MSKKEGMAKVKYQLALAAVIIVVVLVVVSNSSSSAPRGGDSKKPDLTSTKTDLINTGYSWGENSALLASLQLATAVANIGGTRAKESILEVGMHSDYTLEGVKAFASGLYSTGTFQSATTTYFSASTGSATIGIKINPLLASTGEHYNVAFLNVPLRLPPRDGTAAETKFTFFGLADATSIIGESNENNNRIERSYIVHCTFQDSQECVDLILRVLGTAPIVATQKFV